MTATRSRAANFHAGTERVCVEGDAFLRVSPSSSSPDLDLHPRCAGGGAVCGGLYGFEETLEERLLGYGFTQEQIDKSLAEPEIFAKLPRKS